MAWTNTLDTATPTGGTDPKTLDTVIQTHKKAWQERLNTDHYMPLTGTEVSDTSAGKHRKITFQAPLSDITLAASQGGLFVKDVSAKAELHWKDEDSNTKQLTSAGILKIVWADLADVYKDEDTMTSDSATHLPTQQSVKAYVDTEVAAVARSYIKVIDSKANGSDGQALTGSSWNTRELTTEETDTGNNASVATNQITLDAGTYECRIWCPVYQAANFVSQLYNVTDGATELLGTAGTGGSSSGRIHAGWIMGRFTIAGAKAFDVRTYPSDLSKTGVDLPAGAGVNNVYTVAEFWKIG